MFVDMYRVSCVNQRMAEDIALTLGRIQDGFRGTDGCSGQRLLRELKHHESFIVVSYWRDKESLANASVPHAAIDEALDHLEIETVANAYEIIHEL